MNVILAVGLQTWATAITVWVGAVLGVMVTVMIGFGLVLAYRARLHPQVVIPDVELDESIPAEAAAGLSRQLRDTVRRILRRQGDEARQAEMETLEEDIAAGLVTVHGVTTLKTTVAELDRTTADSMSTLSASLRAIAPKEAEGLASALEFAIPAQRGWMVRASPTVRGDGADAQAGLSVEVAPLGRAPDATTTFWTTSAALQAPPSEAARLAAMRGLLNELVLPASVWIAIRLVSRHLVEVNSWSARLVPSRRSREKELKGLQLQFGGQLLLYATRHQEKFARGFAYEALEDLERAAELLPGYYRPFATQAAVRERLGWSYRQSGELTRAQRAFTRAVHAYDEAEKLLQACAKANPAKQERAVERLALRRTKCRLLSCESDQGAVAWRELAGYSQLKDARPESLYNAACLFAVAMMCPDLPDAQRMDCERRAWDFLGYALALTPRSSGLWSRAMTDEELGALDPDTRARFADEIKKRCGTQGEPGHLAVHRTTRAVLAALGLTDPGTKAAV